MSRTTRSSWPERTTTSRPARWVPTTRSRSAAGEHQLDIGASLLADFSFSNGNLMWLAHCRVKVGRQAHFTWAQVAVWNPGMTASPGMRGGVFARRGQTDFMVLSLWNSVVDHERYVTGRFVDLRRKSRAADDLDGITGDLVELDPAWTVTP